MSDNCSTSTIQSHSVLSMKLNPSSCKMTSTSKIHRAAYGNRDHSRVLRAFSSVSLRLPQHTKNKHLIICVHSRQAPQAIIK
ncbi:unnamed protein product, partial [Amoebophrya sp. A25]|eukprot:GSA25T00011252001.1